MSFWVLLGELFPKLPVILNPNPLFFFTIKNRNFQIKFTWYFKFISSHGIGLCQKIISLSDPAVLQMQSWAGSPQHCLLALISELVPSLGYCKHQTCPKGQQAGAPPYLCSYVIPSPLAAPAWICWEVGGRRLKMLNFISPCWRWRGLMEGPCCPFPSLFPLCWMTLFSPCPYFLLILWRGIFHCVYSKMHQCPSGTYLLCCKGYDVNNSSSVSCWQGSPGRRGPQGEQGEPGPKVSLGVPWEVMHWGGWDHVIN